MQQIGIVSCSLKKIEVPNGLSVPAGELYQGELFRKAQRLFELKGRRYYILSAKYGLLRPDQKVTNYNFKITEHSPAELNKWADDVAEALIKAEPSPVVIDMYAAECYYSPLASIFEAFGHRLNYPLKGLGGIGYQLHKLKIEIDALEAHQKTQQRPLL